MLDGFLRWVLNQRRWVVLVVLLLTALLGTQIRNLEIVINPTAMLPQSHPNVIGTNLAEQLFGSRHVVVVGLSHTDNSSALQPALLQASERIRQGLGAISGVKMHTLLAPTADKARAIEGVQGELLVEPLLATPINEESIEAFRRNVQSNPVYQQVVLSQDQRVVALSFAIEAGAKGFHGVVDQIQAVVNKELPQGVEANLSGTPVFFAAVERFAQRMGILFPVALLVIGLVHLEAFRTLQGLLLPLLTAVLAVVWSLGIMGASGVPMDAFNSTTPILILAVAAGHAVQILKRYYEEYDEIRASQPNLAPCMANEQAVFMSLRKVAPVMLAAGGVAALGFFSLLTFEIATIRTFGLFTGLGVVSALLIELTFIPALRACLLPPKLKLVNKTQTTLWDALADTLTNWILHRRRFILWGFLLLTCVSSLGIAFLNQENSTKSYFGESLPIRQSDAFLNEHLAGTNTLYVVFQGKAQDAMKQPSTLQLIEDTQRFIEGIPEVGKTMSVVDFIKIMNQSLHNGDTDQLRLPASSSAISELLLLYSIAGQPTDFDPYIDYSYRNANLIVWMKNDSSTYANFMVQEIKNYLQQRLPSDVTVQIGGSVPQSAALSETLIQGKLANIGQMVLVVLVLGAIIFRSIRAAVYLVLPLLVTVMVNFGVMGLTGIPLNTPNSVSSALAIGIGADYAIYLLYRMREEQRRLQNFDEALRTTMRTAGKAVVYVATAIAGGYSVLLLSLNFYVHIWFGILIALSMVVSAATALVLIPALVKTWPPCFLRARTDAPKQLVKNNPPWAKAACVLLLCGLSALGFDRPVQAASTNISANTNAQELMEKNYQATRYEASVSEAVFTLSNEAGQSRVRKTFAATKLSPDGLSNKRVVRFLSPADVRNTATLMVEQVAKDDDIFIYLPSLKKSRRLSSNNKRNSFVGTDLSFGDVIGHKPGDWNHTLLRTESSSAGPVLVIESTPKTATVAADTGYGKRISWLQESNAMANTIEFYDTNNTLLKTLQNKLIQKVGESKTPKWQAMWVQVKNHQTGHTTTVELSKFEVVPSLGDDYFSTRYIEKEE